MLTDDLLESVRTTITSPVNQVLLTDDRLLDFGNQEIDSKVVPMISSLNQDYFTYLETEAITSGQDSYDIPYRAIGRTLRDLKIIDSSGSVRNISKVQLEDAHLYRYNATPQAFYFFGDQIKLAPTPDVTGVSLQKFYLIKPSKMVLESDAGKVTAVSGTSVTVNMVPSSFVVGAKVDAIKGKQGHRLLDIDRTISGVAGLVLTLDAAVTGLAVGDYIAYQCETPVIQLPDEVLPYLIYLMAKRCLETLGDYEGVSAIDKEILIRKKNCEYLLAPRIEGESTKILQRYGLLRGHRGRYVRGIVY